MTEKELLHQLNSLKKISPSEAWLKSNREILLSQINNSAVKEINVWQRIVIDVRSFTRTVSQPAIVLGSLLVALVGVSAFSHLAFNRTKPNDSLYIARIISEKAKLSTVFSDDERQKLEVKFAADHAEAIVDVLAAANPEAANEDQLAHLNESFNKEISTVRTKIAAIKKSSVEIKTQLPSEEDVLVTAGNGKNDSGMQISLTGSETPAIVSPVKDETDEPDEAVDSAKTREAEKILDEAKTLFENKDYGSALDKIKEVKEMIK